MKKHLKKIIMTPKLSIGLALIIAVTIGVISNKINNQKQLDRSDKINKELVYSENTENKILKQDLTLAFPVGGRIKNVSVKIGDTVKAGTVLASLDAENTIGAVNQAKGAYSAAQTNYEKLLNGTSTPDIEIAKVSLNNAKNAYENSVTQQKVIVANALSNMRNSGLVVVPTSTSTGNLTFTAPTISGTYTGTNEGNYNISIFNGGSGDGYFSTTGLENTTETINTTAPIPLGTHGLYIQFPSNYNTSAIKDWTLNIPNYKSVNYGSNYNAYQLALQNQTQTIAIAQGVIDTAQATLEQKQAGTRSEDILIAKAQVESTQGTLQIAQGIYNNTVITAPVNGTITNVSITSGQIATANTPAIELLSQ